jgi:hypothetical protein
MRNEQVAISKERQAILSRSSLCSLLTALFSFVLFIANGSFVIAQDEETRFMQRLTWTGDEYAWRYEVVIEREGEGEYRELLREFTNALFIEVLLLPGKYRCLVITYDFLNQVGEASEWKYIEVFTLHSESVYKIDDTEPNPPANNKVDIFLSTAWMPSFAIYDEENRFFGRNMSLSGAALRFGVVWAGGTSSENNFNFKTGLELAVPYSFFNAGSGGQDALHLLGFGLNLLAQKWLPGNRAEQVSMALTFRLGAGYTIRFFDDGAAHSNIGVSFLLFVMDNLYLETGLDYTHWFTDMPSGCFRPWVGIQIRR